MDEPEPSPWLKQLMVNAKYAWKFASMWVLGAAAVAPMALEFIPSLSGVLSPSQEHFLSTGFALLAAAARLVPQKGPST